MAKSAPQPAKPIDWPRAELEYRAGRPLRAIAEKAGCSHGLINRRAKRDGWLRDLKPRIHALADEMVSNATVSAPVSMATPDTEKAAILAAGAAEASVRLAHRADVAKGRRLAMALLSQLEGVVDTPDAFALVYDALSNPDEPAIAALRDLATLVASVPGQMKVLKDWADIMHKVIGMEREAFGMNSEGGTGDRYTVVIKDYTGRGSAEAPPKPADEDE